MAGFPDINEYIGALKGSPRMGSQVGYHTVLPPQSAGYADPATPLPGPLSDSLNAMGAERLYSHQAAAIDIVRRGAHVVVATPTASGKTLIYNLPTLERCLENSEARALYLFPLKALAQDQLRTFTGMAAALPEPRPTAAIYDGDTSAWHRKKLREKPPNVLLTNPEMLHLSFLAHHEKWTGFLSGLRLVVVDEVHTYRGVMGSHMAMVFRRFLRICRRLGADPVFVFSSATIANPAELAEQLTGLRAVTITETGAPRGRKHLILMDPVQGPAQTAILLLKAALHRGLRTIVYVQSRKMAELIAIWAGRRSGAFSDKISAYRAGFLPEERREIESRLSGGDILAVITTSALELGIDIGDLDLCLLVGYPGTIVATLQRGGRVGRSGQDAAVILIPGEDALDQYFLRNPLELISRPPEAAVINPHNTTILGRHLVCAAAEMSLETDEPFLQSQPVQQAVRRLESEGELLRSGDGNRLFSRRKAPHRQVDLRGCGSRFTIIDTASGECRGEIDGFRAFRETHPGAVYLHNGRTFTVKTLDLAAQTAKISPAEEPFYTRVRASKETEIIEITASRRIFGTEVCRGKLKVTEQVTGYEKWQIHARKKISVLPLDLPPHTFETEGLWIKIPFRVQQACESEERHFMGGIHAIEHAAIGIFPLLVMADRNDLGGISTPFHPQVESAAVFIYDGIPGGAGLSHQAFHRAESLLTTTLKAIQTCRCENGCPSCVHSPKCGSGNRPIDKDAARFILEKLVSGAPLEPARYTRAPTPPAAVAEPAPAPFPTNRSEPPRFGVLDVETRRSAAEVGGWHYADRMGISCAVLYDSAADRFIPFLQSEIENLVDHLKRLDLIIGFNIRRFDYRVLGGLSPFRFLDLNTLDILEEVRNHLGFRLSLDHLAQATLGAAKTADGLQALKWWKEGKIQEIIDYCSVDVKVTRDLYLFGRDNGYLLFRNKSGATVRVPVTWGNGNAGGSARKSDGAF